MHCLGFQWQIEKIVESQFAIENFKRRPLASSRKLVIFYHLKSQIQLTSRAQQPINCKYFPCYLMTAFWYIRHTSFG